MIPSNLTPKPKGTNIIKAVGKASAALDIINAIVPKKVFDKTFAAVFGNGFNIKCWGASRNPKMAEGQLAAAIPPLNDAAQYVLRRDWDDYAKAVNQFWVDFYNVHPKSRDWLTNGAKDCTRDGLLLLVKGLDRAGDGYKSAFLEHAKESGHNLIPSHKVQKTYYPNIKGARPWTTMVQQYNLIKGKSTTKNILENVGESIIPSISKTPVSSSSLGIVAMAVLALFFGRKFVKI